MKGGGMGGRKKKEDTTKGVKPSLGNNLRHT
jgi:hypothetical protein